MKFITSKTVIDQLKKDLIGKDSYRGVTLTYSWLANQFGHFSLGFIPTFILYKVLVSFTNASQPEIWAALSIWMAWILFELYNFLGPLLLKSPTKRSPTSRNNYTFMPEWTNIAFDTATDLVFFGAGACAASLLCAWSPYILTLFIILIILMPYPAYHWYTTKMYIQNAEYPFQHRLSQWNQKIRDEHKLAILNFLNNEERGKHLLLFGSRGSGKTTLSVGIATEASIRSQPCSYVTAVKLLCMFFEKEENPEQRRALWSWRDSSMLVIDDINPGGLIQGDILNTRLFYKLLNNLDFGQQNIKYIREKNIIWVMGNEDPTRQAEDRWQNLLEQIGINRSNIITVNLDRN